MKEKILMVCESGSLVRDDVAFIRKLYGHDMELSVCQFKTINSSDRLTEQTATADEASYYSFQIIQKLCSHSAWVTTVASSLDTIFEKYIPDVVILVGYTMITVAAATSAYFMGSKVIVLGPVSFGIAESQIFDYFPMDKGLEILIALVDQHICRSAEFAAFLITNRIPESKIQRTSLILP